MHSLLHEDESGDERGQILSLDDQRRAYRDGNQLWHTDSSFRQKSATWSMLHARVIRPDDNGARIASTLPPVRGLR